MMTGNSISKVPVVSKQYCSGSEIVLYVRRRPHVVNGGGFVVVDGNQKIVFRVDGCGILGRKEELVVRAGDGSELLLVRRKGGVMEALSLCRRWRGYAHDLEGSQKPIFCLREPSNSCLWMKNPITISVTSNEYRGFRDFEIRGDFCCKIYSISKIFFVPHRKYEKCYFLCPTLRSEKGCSLCPTSEVGRVAPHSEVYK
ncbi:unnamed protein product [Coffea canephora]|uniref:Uncharacterized protein n=1 Tax=Coffea canephora TaxID=49390 RepID=A0A068U639_COFCA|nr:unnamed protein product [Coffea canephora]